MIVTGMNAQVFKDIVKSVADAHYDGNIEVRDYSEHSARRFNASIKAIRSGSQEKPRDKEFLLKGARFSTSFNRTCASCWHVYRDVLANMFEVNPQLRVKSGRFFIADYNGYDKFYEDFPNTIDAQMGSMFAPATYGDLCECPSDTNRNRYTPLFLDNNLIEYFKMRNSPYVNRIGAKVSV